MPHPYVFWVLALCDAHHPQEFIDVITRVSNHASEDYQHVVYVQ